MKKTMTYGNNGRIGSVTRSIEKEGSAMKGMAKKAFLAAFAAAMILAGGCIVVDDSNNSSSSNNDACCANDVTYYEVWEAAGGPISNTLDIGDACCDPCGGDYDYSYDTLYFDSWDSDIADLQLNYTLTNYSNQFVPVWVDLCDDIGCENVIEFELYPGETWWERVPNPVLDTALDAYYQCLYDWGNDCYLSYNVEVWFGEDNMCVPISMDYYYDGLYVY